MYNTTIASPSDIPELLPLINSAYRGEASRQGWTTEADFIAGDLRTDADDLARLMARPGAVFLVARDTAGPIGGCVFGKTRCALVPGHVICRAGITRTGNWESTPAGGRFVRSTG